MPLPWLIGAAAVAAAAAVVKAVSDDDDDSSYTCGEEERREQEREAERQRQRKSLKTHLANLKKSRLEYAHTLLARSAEGLGKPLEIVVQSESEYDSLGRMESRLPGARRKLTLKKLESALKSKELATSEYAQAVISILRTDETSQYYCTQKEIKAFLTNLRVLDSLSSRNEPISDKKPSYSSMLTGNVGVSLMLAEESVYISLSDGEREDCEKARAASNRIERLQQLKSKIKINIEREE
ncbi:hypothetical protein R5M92_04060 [Halomonas sp. Bachu 37]|uniref:hypothetical protein n=1 Tax=Halomonas kashgarensis TaxID=3084920 RepID=UPI003216EDA8